MDLVAQRMPAAADPRTDVVLIVRTGALFPVYRTFSLLEEIPAGKFLLSQGGIRTRDAAAELERAGVDAAIVGPWAVGEGLVGRDGAIRCQWCHGAPGIGLARLGMIRHVRANAALAAKLGGKLVATDVSNAAASVRQAWPGQLDTLCCGTLGGIEFLCEAADDAVAAEHGALAAHRLAAILTSAARNGDYRWNSGKRQFNLGLFRGLAGVGYTLLRRIDRSLPNVLVWE